MLSKLSFSSLEFVKVLLIEDDEDDYLLTRELFEEIQGSYDYHLDWSNNYEDGYALLRQQKHHIYLIDYRLGHRNGLDLLKMAIADGIRGPFILLTGQSDHEIDLEAMELGASDYLIKGEITAKLLERSIRYALEYYDAMQQLKQSEIHYRNLFKLSPDSIVISTIDDGRILDFNDSFAQLLGYSREEIIQRTSTELKIWMKSTDRDIFKQTLEKQGFINNYQLEHWARNGDLKHIIVSAEIIDSNDEQCILSIIRDITERVAFEKERENLISELDAFAHTVAHDLKNPLSVIIGYSQLMSPSNSDENFITDKLYDFIGLVNKQSSKMNNIIDELLRFASLKHHSQIELSRIDMDHIICEVQVRLSWMITEYNAEISVPKKWPITISYGPWIEEVWTNYISNAIKYGDSPPIIELGTDIHTNGQRRFWVKDNGKGLTLEEQSKLFEEFSRLDLQIKGHGLGLSIVKRIVERLGGTVGIESSIDKGSLFYFTLPSAV